MEENYTTLFNGDFGDAWQMIGQGRFNKYGMVIESEGGTGLLRYKKERFKNFNLKLDWRVMDSADNSGIYVRVPDVDLSNPEWLQEANKGGEVQIDERSFDSTNNTENNPLKVTGAIMMFPLQSPEFLNPFANVRMEYI